MFFANAGRAVCAIAWTDGRRRLRPRRFLRRRVRKEWGVPERTALPIGAVPVCEV